MNGYKQVIRTLRLRSEKKMALIERLKELSTIEKLDRLYKERYMEHFDIDVWHDAIDKEWPKILDVIDSARKTVEEYEQFGSFTEDCELAKQLKGIRFALTALKVSE